MQIAAMVEQNSLYTSKAYDLGRGIRSDPVEGIPQYTPGPGRYELKREFDDAPYGFDFGRSAAHGDRKIDLRLTSNDDDTTQRMLQHREGTIGDNCKRDTAHRQAGDKGEVPYKGPGHEPVVSSFAVETYKIRSYNERRKKAASGQTKPVKQQKDAVGPGQYPIKLAPGGPSYQFGSRFDDKRVPPTHVKADGTRFDSALRAKPHLKPKKVEGPGPGDYKLADSVQTRKRESASAQVSTWGTGREPDHRRNMVISSNFVTPGPAQYMHVYADVRPYPKPHMAEGYTFQQGIRDIQKSPDLAKDPPGPGNYDPQLPKSGTSKSFLGGTQEVKPTKHNGVPSPGKHSPKHPPEAPSWSFASKHESKIKKDDAIAGLGPGTHDPNHLTHTTKCAAFTMASKTGKGPAVETDTKKDIAIRIVQKVKRDQVQQMGVPGPQYNIPGDFDFPDPRNPDDANAPGKKKAKFAFGMKFNTRAKNLDMPGPGEYETDTVPMSMKNPAYWIGTDVRKDLGVPYAYQYPGPFENDPIDVNHNVPSISFTRDAKKCSIEKTNDPGPATYATYAATGVMPQYQRNEANARIVALQPKREE